MLRRGNHKLHYSLGDPPQLYDLSADPNEFHDLAQESAYRTVVDELRTQLLAHWHPVVLERQVRQSQADRMLIEQAYQESIQH